MSTSRSDNEAAVPQVANRWYEDWIQAHVLSESARTRNAGKVAIVTGSNSGTGFWCASALAGGNFSVVLACRNLERAKHAKDEIVSKYPDAQVDCTMSLDTSDLSSVRAFAEAFKEKYDRLDLLVNNAGVMALPYSTTSDGYEIQFQTNHLGHFLLTQLLWEKLVNKDTADQPSRVVQHSSGAHYMGWPYFSKDHMENPQHGWIGYFLYPLIKLFGLGDVARWMRYGVSKLCNVLFMKGLAQRIEDKQLTDKVISLACHPGFASTGLQKEAERHGSFNSKWNESSRAQSAADGSLPLLMCCVGPIRVDNGNDNSGDTDTGAVGIGAGVVSNGGYYGPEQGTIGPPVRDTIGGYGNDPNQIADLWAYSEECTGTPFDI